MIDIEGYLFNALVNLRSALAAARGRDDVRLQEACTEALKAAKRAKRLAGGGSAEGWDSAADDSE